MKRDYRDYIIDIINSLNEIYEFTKGMKYAQFQSDKKTVNAVIRSLEVMGEATKKIPEEIKKKYSDVPWKEMNKMRNKLIHEYFGIDLEIIWEVVKKELPPIKPFIKKLAKEIKNKPHI